VAVPATQEAIRWQDPAQLQRVLDAQQESLRFRPEADPRLGEAAPHLALFDTTGRRLDYPPPDAPDPTVLLFIGDCTSCFGKTLSLWEQVRAEGHAVYVVTSSDPAEARTFLAQSRLRMPVLLERTDPGSAARYNAAFRPRAYVIDASGRLIYAQPEDEASSDAVQAVSSLLREAAESVGGMGRARLPPTLAKSFRG
jgi:peroxiredoxin